MAECCTCIVVLHLWAVVQAVYSSICWAGALPSPPPPTLVGNTLCTHPVTAKPHRHSLAAAIATRVENAGASGAPGQDAVLDEDKDRVQGHARGHPLGVDAQG